MTPHALLPDQPPAAATLRLARRRLAQARWLHVALLASVLSGFILGPIVRLDVITYVALLAAGAWVLLGARAARLGRRARAAWSSATLGRVDDAEAGARDVLGDFCLMRPVTLAAVQALAVAAHQRQRFAESARLATFVLGRREKLFVGDRTNTRLMLVDALLGAGDTAAARAALAPLYRQKLVLRDALALLSLQLRVDAASGQFARIVTDLAATLETVELMPPAESARAQAILLLAAERQGLAEWAAFLRRRVSLLADWPELVRREPSLAQIAPAGEAGPAT